MANRRLVRLLFYVICIAFDLTLIPQGAAAAQHDRLLTGKAAMDDWTTDAPGVRRKITIEDLPAPVSPTIATRDRFEKLIVHSFR